MKSNRAFQNRRPRERGFFLVIVMLMLVSIMLLYVAANGRRLTNLRQEIRLIEQQQIQRLNHSGNVTTNNLATPAVAILSTS